MPTTVLEVLKKATAYFEGRGLDSPRLDAEVLIAHGLKLRRIDLYLQHDRPLSEPELLPLRRMVAERGRGTPVAYLVGEREFYALPFTVTPAVLVPRPETEGLVDAALSALKGVADPHFVDVGTGSGCIAVAVLHAIPSARALATDVSAEALAVARGNAERHRVAARFEGRTGHLLDPARGDPSWGRLDAVLSNPPYVVRGDPALEPAVAAHEPALALYVPGRDPLTFAREIATAALEALRPGGFLGLEIGAGSGEEAKTALEGLGYVDVGVVPDGAGIPRVARGRRP